MKKSLTAILIVFFAGTAVAQGVNIGKGVIIGQDETRINTTGNFTVDNLITNPASTIIDRSKFTVDSSNGSTVLVRLSYFNREAALQEYVINHTATTQAPNATFEITNLDNTFYRALIEGNAVKTEQLENGVFNYTYSGFNYPDYTQFNVLKYLDKIPPQFSNVGTVGGETIYNVNNPDPINLVGTAIDEDTGIVEVKLATNETRKFENRTLNYGGIRTFDPSEETVNFNFKWDNAYDITQDQTVGWKIWAKDEAGNWNSTKIRTFQITESPILEKVTVENVRQGEVSTLKAYAVDPTGYGDILNVTFKVTKPNGETVQHIRATRGKRFTYQGYSGNIYTYNYTDTIEPGTHIVKAIVYDEQQKDSKEAVMSVGPISEFVQKFILNPLYLGQSTLIQALLIIIKKQIEIFAILVGIGGFIVYANYETEQGLSRAVLEQYRKNFGDDIK